MKDFYVIVDATIIKVDEPLYNHLYHSYIPAKVQAIGSMETVECTVETIRGRRFYKRGPNHLDVVIGWDSKLQDFLGVPIEAWEDYESEKIAGIRAKKEKVKVELLDLYKKIEQATFLQRLKYLVMRKL